MVQHVRNAVLAFESYTSCQAEHENRSLKALGGTKPQQNIDRYAKAMVNKAEHRYQVKASVSGRAIVATQLWSKSITDLSLTRIAEGLCRVQVTGENNYFVKSIGQFYFYVVAKKVELSPIAIPGGHPQIVRLRFVKFEVDGSVCCSCDFFERVGIVCIHILAIVHNLGESMVDVRWRAALGFYFGNPMYARVTSVIMQALESSLKKVKACIPSLETSYPVYSDGVNESFFSPFFKRGVERRFIIKIKYLLHRSAWKGYNEQVFDIPASYMNSEASSDEEMANNKFIVAASVGASDFHSRLLADTASRRKLKVREAITVPFLFLCDYADQSDQQMSCIATRLEILKDEIPVFHEKNQQVQEHSKGKNLSGLGSCGVPLEKARTWARGETHKHG
jgi:hypothetical protein